MFERFTDRARKVMALANQEAQRFNHEYIGTEHILLGLAKEGSGIGANVLKNLGVDLCKVRLEVEKLVRSAPDMVTMGRLPHTTRAKVVIENAISEARNMNNNWVGTEHLLLGLLLEPDGVACQVLMNLGLCIENVRKELHRFLKEPPKTDNPINMPIRDSDRTEYATIGTYTSCGSEILGLAVDDKNAKDSSERFIYNVDSGYFVDDDALMNHLNNIGRSGGEVIHIDTRDTFGDRSSGSPKMFARMIFKTKVKHSD